MQIGDIVIFVGKRNTSYFTINKHYIVYKVKHDFIPGCTCGWIIDDSGEPVYFRDTENDIAWKYVKLQDVRKEKLEKLEKLNNA